MSNPTSGGFHTSEWPERIGSRGVCPPGASLAAFWGVLGHTCPPEKGPKWVGNRSKSIFSKSDRGPLGVPVDVIVARFEAYLGRLDRPYVPKKSSQVNRFGTQKW